MQKSMTIANLKRSLDLKQLGQEMYSLIAELYPICRSITGNGVRRTLHRLQEFIPLTIHEVPSGTQVFDWTVPKEWNITDAYIKDSKGERLIDFHKSNLHVVSYSTPIKKLMSLSEMKRHLFTLPDHPDWIPYRTSYYKEDWGFCLTHEQLLALKDEEYEVCIESSLKDGYLTYGEYFIQGETEDEFLISCHVCHPSLCNDNLSGIALVAHLAKSLAQLSLRYSYRFLFIPGTIGSITWLALNDDKAFRVKHGLVVACVGDSGKSTYKKSRRGDAEIDKTVAHVLKESAQNYEIIDFFPYGYDERQYCSPGFNLPVGCLMRTPHGRYSEYHTSSDNLDFVKPELLQDSFMKYLAIVDVTEGNKRYLNRNPKCEPQLGKRGLYEAIGGQKDSASSQLAMLWVLNLSDGQHTLLDISEQSGLVFDAIRKAAIVLMEHDILREYDNNKYSEK
jgi:aminopeptidase-like protein